MLETSKANKWIPHPEHRLVRPKSARNPTMAGRNSSTKRKNGPLAERK